MKKIDYRKIISIILVVCMVVLSELISEESVLGIANNRLSQSNSLHYLSDGERLLEAEDAIVPSNIVHEYSTDEYRALESKGNGEATRQLRILQFSFVLLCSIFAIPLLWAFYVYFIGEREQKRLIIKYIHNKDGLKSTSIIKYS